MTPVDQIKARLATETDPVKVAALSAQLDAAQGAPPAPVTPTAPSVPGFDAGGGVGSALRDPNGATTLPPPQELKQGIDPTSTIGRVKAPVAEAPAASPEDLQGAAPSGGDLASQAINFVDTNSGGGGGPVTSVTKEQTTKVPTANTAGIAAKGDAATEAQKAAAGQLGQAESGKALGQAGAAGETMASIDKGVQDQQAQQAEIARQMKAGGEAAGGYLKAYNDEVKDQSLAAAAGPSLGRKLAGAIALGLGAAGAALSHTQNSALAIMQAGIDEDLKERQARLASKKGSLDAADKLLEGLHKAYGDVGAAGAAYRAAMLERGKLGMEKAVALGTSETAKANAAKNIADIDAAKADAQAKADALQQQSVTTKSKQVSGGGNGLKARLDNYGKALDNALKVEKLTGGGDGEGLKPDELAKVQSTYKTHAALTEAERAIKGNGGVVPMAGLRVLLKEGTELKDIPSAVAALVSSHVVTDKEAAAVSTIYGAMLNSVYEASGKQVNKQEFINKALEYGVGANSTPAQVIGGLRRMNTDNHAAKALVFSAFGGRAAKAWARADAAMADPKSAGFEGANPTDYGTQRGN